MNHVLSVTSQLWEARHREWQSPSAPVPPSHHSGKGHSTDQRPWTPCAESCCLVSPISIR